MDMSSMKKITDIITIQKEESNNKDNLIAVTVASDDVCIKMFDYMVF